MTLAGYRKLPTVKLSILMPVYNECATLASAVKDVLNVNFPCEFELVIVDDGSTDGTRDLYPSLTDDSRVRLILHERNRGKGAAIRTAAAAATGDYVIMCDADLEYSPAEIPSLLAPVLAGDAEVVYGTRTFGSHNAYSYAYVLGNKGVTTFANVLFNCYISDLETCFKLMPADAVPDPGHPPDRVRHGGRGDREAAAARFPPLRGADQLQGAQPRGREKAHLA